MPRFSTLIRSKTLRVAGAVAALAVTAPFATSAAGAQEGINPLPCPANRFDTVRANGAEWQRFIAPKFQAGLDVGAVPQEIRSYAVGAGDTRRVAITNGNAVYVSGDGGCSFSMGLALNRVPDPRLRLSGLTTTIKSVFVSPTGTYFALAEELETGATVGRPHVLRSADGRPTTWELADEGLPPLGKALALRAHPNGKVLYLTFSGAREESECPPQPLPCDSSQQGRRLGLMYASRDGGRTWQSRAEPSELDTVSPIKYVSVDDDDPTGDTVWVVVNGRLKKSRDGGRSFSAPDGLNQDSFTFTAVESLARTKNSQGLELVAFSAGREMVRLHRGRWIRSSVPFSAGVDSVAQRPEGDIAVVTAASGDAAAQVWRIYPADFVDYDDKSGFGGVVLKFTFGWEPITPTAGVAPGVGAGATPRNGAGTYYVRDGSRLLRFLGTSARAADRAADGVTLNAPPPPTGRITPPVLDFALAPGKTRTVEYTLTLPPSPTPLDVYLLVDNSGSMLPFINDLKANLADVVRALHASGVDVGVGIGQINVQPDKLTPPVDDPRTEDVDESEPLPMYQRLREIGPIDEDLFIKLSKLDGGSGGGSEPQLEALDQAINGTGLSLHGLGPLVGYSIPEGQNAVFREELSPIKVIVHATDENFTGTTEFDGTPDKEQIQGSGADNSIPPVAQVLRTANVKQIGLSMDLDGSNRDAHEDLQEMARLTGTFAPAGGVDCDGDGRIGKRDVKPRAPLVCGQGTGLDKTLVNLLKSLSDPATITLSKNAAPTLARISHESFAIDAKQSTTARFTVTYSCEGVAPGEYVNDITAGLRGLVIAKASATVECGGVRGAAAPRQQPPQLAVEPGSNPPPPQPQPAPPAPVPVNPVPQVQTQPQVQSQVNPQAGMADQEEEQLQLAGAENDIARDEDQLAMVGLSYEDSPGVVLALGMTLASAAGAVALRRRSRTATAKVTVRR